jgi:hypothetical protein
MTIPRRDLRFIPKRKTNMTDHIVDADEMDALRQHIRTKMAERSLAMTDVARQTGIPYGTFSSWMGNTYRGRQNPIAEQARHWLAGLEAADRTRALAPKAPGFLQTPTAGAILATLEHAQFMPEFVVITGAPGARLCAAQHQCVADHGRAHHVHPARGVGRIGGSDWRAFARPFHAAAFAQPDQAHGRQPGADPGG